MMNGGGFPSQLPPLNGGMFPQGAYMPQTRLSLPMPPGVMLSANQPSTSEIGSQILGGVGGAVTGAAIGTAVFPGVGTVGGGILGALGGSKIGEAVGGFIGNVGGGLIGGAIDGIKNFFKSIF